MKRLARFDAGSLLGPRIPRLVSQLAFGLACAGLLVVARAMVDGLAPGAGPFALVYPAILLATLFGHWQAGLVTYLISFAWTLWYVIPPSLTFSVADPDVLVRAAVNAVAALVVLVFAEAFRSAVRSAAGERDREIEQGKVLRAELEHRTKNNFQMIVSVLEIQRRDEPEPAARQALAQASSRVGSFAEVCAGLPVPESSGAQIRIRSYLEHIIAQISRAVFTTQVRLVTDIADLVVPRSTAMAMGLYVNEALTNCAKHAFPESRGGTVHIALAGDAHGWALRVSDDGAGLSGNRVGTGSKLMHAFARQAGATHTITFPDPGCEVTLQSASG